jgi:ABC-2 type transport system permease protein
VVALTLGVDFQADGVLPSIVLLGCFVPFVWGLGLIAAGVVVTFRRGGGVIGVTMAMLGLASGAFFPLALLPGWLQAVAEANPVAIAIEGTREALIGGTGWSDVGTAVLILVPLSAAAVLAGVVVFRTALAREYRNGTLGLY